MRLPEFDPRATQVEDQRGQNIEPESFWGTAVRGISQNWEHGGLAGLLGLSRWLGPAPAPIRTLGGQTFDLPADLAAPAYDPQYRPAQLRSGALRTVKRELKSGAV